MHLLRFKKNKFKVSVIVPIYNAENHINKCFDSLLRQNLDSVEIIAINDCSTDKSLDLINNYSKYFQFFNIINHTNNTIAFMSNLKMFFKFK